MENTNLKIFTSNIDNKTKEQINLILEQEAFKDCKIRIMPDCHAGKGCVIGFTANLGDKVIPNIVGVDIGCGMSWVKTNFTRKDIDLQILDEKIKKFIPSGMTVNPSPTVVDNVIIPDLTKLHCYNLLKNPDHYLEKSMCSLGGGNHFIELDEDKEGNIYIVVHTGSRNLGKQVCDIYQKKAMEHCSYKEEMQRERAAAIDFLKSIHKEILIQDVLEGIYDKYNGHYKLPKELCYIEGQDRQDYLDDMRFCQFWAKINRMLIVVRILKFIGYDTDYYINNTIHNYIDETNMVRKGAISAHNGEKVLIPLNMRDGCIIGNGKGNSDWNYSAPHGAGRILSRAQARSTLSLTKYKWEMQGIFSTSVCNNTLDESPMAYKSSQEIIDNIQDTVEILEIIKPIYNFKAKD